MRFLVIVKFALDVFNAAERDGSVGEKIQKILAEQKPEAVYFTELGGERSAVLVVDLAEASEIPRIAEPWFLRFNAKLEMHPVMTPEDLGKAGLLGGGRSGDDGA
ncbi:MAG: hypothetical protein NVSMB3_15650 [Acidobacteriaceae bacterium]